jgi:hypothetical protein
MVSLIAQHRPPAPCQKGDRIRLVQMGPDPCPIPPGATGTVRCVTYIYPDWQVSVSWDIHRSLLLVWPVDKFEVIARPRATYFQFGIDPTPECLGRNLRGELWAL